MGLPSTDHRRPAAGVLAALDGPCRLLLLDRAAFDVLYLSVLDGVLAPGHPLREAPGLALEVMDVVLGAVLSGDRPESIEAECCACGERCADAGLPDDTFAAAGRALTRAARETAGEAWSAATSSGWAAVQLWVLPHLSAGAARARARGELWQSFPELAPPPDVPASGESASAASEWDLLERAAGLRRPEPPTE